MKKEKLKESFKHEGKELSKEEVMKGRSSAYEFIDFDKQETTLEEVAENFWLNDDSMTDNDRISYVNGFVTCAKWQQERSYSEEEVLEMLNYFGNEEYIKQWFEQFKKK